MSTVYAVRFGSRKHQQNTREAIAKRRTFQTSGALRGYLNSDGDYYVYSYKAIIAKYQKGKWHLAVNEYTATTTWHQKVVKEAMSLAGANYKEHDWFLKP